MTQNAKIVLAVVVVALLTLGGIYWYNSNKQKDTAQEKADKIIKEAKKEIKKSKNTKHIYINAKKAYEITKQKAQSWSNDVKVIEISSFADTDKDNGTAIRWEIRYYSPSQNKDYSIYVTDAELGAGREKSHSKGLEEITENWINSDKAMEYALKYLNGEQCRSYWLGLSGNRWNIKCSRQDKEPKWVKIDATTGEKISERVGY